VVQEENSVCEFDRFQTRNIDEEEEKAAKQTKPEEATRNRMKKASNISIKVHAT